VVRKTGVTVFAGAGEFAGNFGAKNKIVDNAEFGMVSLSTAAQSIAPISTI
jgi:hypothetical protein